MLIELEAASLLVAETMDQKSGDAIGLVY